MKFMAAASGLASAVAIFNLAAVKAPGPRADHCHQDRNARPTATTMPGIARPGTIREANGKTNIASASPHAAAAMKTAQPPRVCKGTRRDR